MCRIATVFAIFIAWPMVACAQRTVEPTETVIRLTVQPVAAPRPALKYQLLPELKEMNPGNPIHAYSKCFAEQNNFFFNKQAVDDREKWQVMPLSELPAKDLLDYGGHALRQADWAARLETPDWGILLKVKSDGVRLLLPDLQQLRMLSSALKVRFRAQVAEKHFDDAIGTAKTMFGLSRHVGTHPTLIGDLVALAIANVAIGPLEEMLQQPGCPNLYWALSNLPTPLISIRQGLQGERLMIETEFAGIDLSGPLSEDDLKKLMGRLDETVRLATAGPVDVKSWLEEAVKHKKHVAAARKRLVEMGLKEARVKEFPAVQIVLLDQKRAFEERRDEVLKWMLLPYWQAEAGLTAAPAALEPGGMLFDQLFIAPLKVRKAQARLEQRLALLRHVEAIRLYAAEHDGKLPASLGDIAVPLSVDPFTGEPFRYQVDGQTAEVRGSPPRGEGANAAFNVRYVVTIKK